jgi:hypothetical protein
MIQRIVKLIGSAYSTSGDVHVRATYNCLLYTSDAADDIL